MTYNLPFYSDIDEYDNFMEVCKLSNEDPLPFFITFSP